MFSWDLLPAARGSPSGRVVRLAGQAEQPAVRGLLMTLDARADLAGRRDRLAVGTQRAVEPAIVGVRRFASGQLPVGLKHHEQPGLSGRAIRPAILLGKGIVAAA